MTGLPSGVPAWTARRYPDGTSYLQKVLDGYWVDFRPGVPQDDTLFVTFEAADPPLQRPDAGRYPWGDAFVRKLPGALLGIKPARVDWYRRAALHAFFRSAQVPWETRFPEGRAQDWRGDFADARGRCTGGPPGLGVAPGPCGRPACAQPCPACPWSTGPGD